MISPARRRCMPSGLTSTSVVCRSRLSSNDRANVAIGGERASRKLPKLAKRPSRLHRDDPVSRRILRKGRTMLLSKPSHAGTLLVVSLLAGVAGGCGRRTAAVAATPISVTAYRIEWISANAPPTLKTGETKDIEVSFRNAGAQAISNEMLAVQVR